MSDPSAVELPQAKDGAERLVLRGRPRPAVRFRRGLIVGVTGAAVAALIAISWFALEPPSFRKAAAPIERDEPARAGSPDALAGAPRDYGDVPRLGPPLPGDLGRPILEQQREMEAMQPSADGAAPRDQAQAAAEAERGRRAAAQEAARSAPILAQLGGLRNADAPVLPQSIADSTVAANGPQAVLEASAGPSGRNMFAQSADSHVNPHALQSLPSPWTLSAGAVIPASLITGLDSDIPGTIIAQVTENVRDSATGRMVLIPQGARLIGSYDSKLSYGQRRALLVWTRIVFPDGSSVGLDNMPATDAAGYSGVSDRVDAHTWQLLKGIALSTLLGVGTQLSLGGESELVRAIRESTQQTAANTGERITARNLDVQPTIKVRPGWPVRVLVNKDLVLQPWRG
jgi:type IV secretion system protein VirB10